MDNPHDLPVPAHNFLKQQAQSPFQDIGRRSLYIFCVHTVELIAIPWYLFAAKYADRPVLGISLQYILSLGSIWLICALLQRRRDLIIKLFPARRRTPQVHYAPRH